MAQIELLNRCTGFGFVSFLKIKYLLFVLFIFHLLLKHHIPLLYKLSYSWHKVSRILVQFQMIFIKIFYFWLECAFHQLLVLPFHFNFIDSFLFFVFYLSFQRFNSCHLTTFLVNFRDKAKILSYWVTFAFMRFEMSL